MEIFYEVRPHLLKGSAIALGFFDGVHLGHQTVIRNAISESQLRGIKSAVVTFKDHPRALTHGNSPLLLTLIEQRLAIFETLGVEAVLVLTFTEELCRLSAREYVEKVLVEGMGASVISVGYNHHFGRQREGNAQLLSQLGTTMNFEVQMAKPVYLGEIEVSSSKIRDCLVSGKIDLANQLLSRPYALLGTVVRGEGRGTKIGFPTANMAISPFQILPAQGVYAAKVKIADDERMLHPAVVNIGCRPTFTNENNSVPIMEVHILNFTRDLYNKNLEVSFYKYLRPEMKFSGVEALKEQIALDCQSARNAY